MLQQVALMIRASMPGDLSQFGEGWQIGYDLCRAVHRAGGL